MRSRRRRGDEATQPAALPHLLGDVVISLDTASRQALALGQSLRERLRTLLIHGVLHLIGYDHERSPAEARRMFARERELAAALDMLKEQPATARRRRRELPSGAISGKSLRHSKTR
ncbi:MAG TPA: rRNA maturation RNase YbeY [Candidatus Binataceae bacterium]|nr:rRNA maturation RNase YbeY [Candidatus Binataceae bacterium]